MSVWMLVSQVAVMATKPSGAALRLVAVQHQSVVPHLTRVEDQAQQA